MSQEDVKAVRGLFEAASHGDYETFVLALHPDAEWHNTSSFPGPRMVRGAEAIARFLRDMVETYGSSAGSVDMEIEEIVDANDTLVIGVCGWWRAPDSDVPFEIRWGQTMSFRNGKLVRGEAHRSYSAALEAVGLRE
jgi:ketosteroid isomerase-like protein